MNNNKLDEAALLAGCKGVFGKSSYISLGTAEKPENYVKKGSERASYLGKQFNTVPPKEGRTVDTYFEKEFRGLSQNDKYTDMWRYKDTQPDKKKGFLTSDFSKRDEFSNTIRTEQWREQLRQEEQYSKKALGLLGGTAEQQQGGSGYTPTATRQAEDETLLYDLVFDKEEAGFSGASRTHRDTKNRTLLSHERALGDKMTTTGLAFRPPEHHSKPEYANKPLIRDTFYRKTNVFFPPGCSAEPQA